MNKTSRRFFFSFRSPYSWMAAVRLKREGPVSPFDLELIPFWEPDAETLQRLRRMGAEFLYIPMTRQKHLYILTDVRRLATKLGMRLAWPTDVAPWWELPHLAFLAARRMGIGEPFFWATYEARWEKGLNICDRRTIAEIGRAIGVDCGALTAAPDDDDLREEGANALVQAFEDDVFGVPFFVVGRERFWGVDRLDDFKTVLAAQAATPMTGRIQQASACMVDMDHAGGCG